jgi:NAD(P)H-hydrate epimerase
MKLVSVAEMQAIEREANAHGITYAVMMENAGRGLADVVSEEYGFLQEGGVLGLVGSGNNGGDTLVALALLAEHGWRARAYIIRPRPADDPLMERLIVHGGEVIAHESDPHLKMLGEWLGNSAIVLDGILGTGFRLPLKPELGDVMGFIRDFLSGMAEPACVVAVDCPSGVDCDSGEAAPECFPAELTVTMAAIKQGLLKFPAYSLVGELRVVGIGLPEAGQVFESWRKVTCEVPDEDWVRGALPVRPLDAHKGTFGTALVVAGSTSYTGAALLAGQAAYRIGAGLVTLAVPEPLHAALSGQFPEATWALLPHENGYLRAEAVTQVSKNLSRTTAMLVGPGFGLEGTTGEFLRQLLEQKDLPPLVLDADGLKLLARIPEWHHKLPGPAVLTPHPGEMSVLTGLPVGQIQADRRQTAARFSREWGHVVILKGAFSVIAAPDGRMAVIPVATPALARAGTGDVLAGLVVGLRAQGVAAYEAAVAGAWIHAYAGLRAITAVGNPASVLAGDILHSTIDVLSDLQ